ncbi:MAG: glycine--tRNA ligase [Clostridia bacterium]|nr:glycine--tRNA ligase [Clostridia bacterium]
MENKERAATMEKIVALCKGRGFIFPGSEIYGGLANTWDYGPLGVELKNNVKKAWWQKFVQENPYNVGLDAAILMNPQTWVASGHLAGFSDPLLDCKECHERFRADKMIEDWCAETGYTLEKPIDAFSQPEMKAFIEEHNLPCPTCGKHNFTDIRQFNLMFKTFQGVTEDAKNTVYLRPETAQGIFTNFVNVQRTTRKKMPFGIAQIGKSFRNEITPGNFIFRVREFEQMELEFFCKPGTDLEWFSYWRSFCKQWLLDIGITEEHLRLRDHDPEELCFYSKATTDFEYLFPFGWGELWGVADRTDYDLTQHQNTSGKDLTYFDQEENRRYIPYVVEPSLGVERCVLAVLCDAYDEEALEGGDTRVVMRLAPVLAPFKAAVLPLSKKLGPVAEKLYQDLSKRFSVDYDDAASIGKRYRRQDEIGTPFCITVDFETEETQSVTVRFRDSMQPERVKIADLVSFIEERIRF